MPKNSEIETIRRNADEIPATSPGDLAALLDVADEAIDTSDIPERPEARRRLVRDVDGMLPRRRSVLREAILAEMKARGLTTYALWKEAKTHCPTISETAVGGFLKGRRSVGIEYLEALMKSLDLTINVPSVPPDITPIDRTDELSDSERAWLLHWRSLTGARDAGETASR